VGPHLILIRVATFLWLSAIILPAGAAPHWVIDKDASRIAFSGIHAGRAFTGRFETWTGSVDFDPDAPNAGVVSLSVDLTSAKTGNALYDGTLPQNEWLDSKSKPLAEFRSASITKMPDGSYAMQGHLELKGHRRPIILPFAFIGHTDSADASGTLTINRADFDIGQKSDPKGEWVSPTIRVDWTIRAHRAQ